MESTTLTKKKQTMTKKKLMSHAFPTVGAALERAGDYAPGGGGCVQEHNYRGVVSTSAYLSISHEPAQVGGGTTSFPMMSYADVETQRETRQRSARPDKYSRSEPRWVPSLHVPCKRPDDCQIDYFQTKPTRFGAITMEA